MDITHLQAFFMWCTIINAALLIFTFLIFACVGDLAYRMHSKMFAMPRETFNVTIYAAVGMYKSIWIVFNLVPYLALSIIG